MQGRGQLLWLVKLILFLLCVHTYIQEEDLWFLIENRMCEHSYDVIIDANSIHLDDCFRRIQVQLTILIITRRKIFRCTFIAGCAVLLSISTTSYVQVICSCNIRTTYLNLLLQSCTVTVSKYEHSLRSCLHLIGYDVLLANFNIDNRPHLFKQFGVLGCTKVLVSFSSQGQ